MGCAGGKPKETTTAANPNKSTPPAAAPPPQKGASTASTQPAPANGGGNPPPPPPNNNEAQPNPDANPVKAPRDSESSEGSIRRSQSTDDGQKKSSIAPVARTQTPSEHTEELDPYAAQAAEADAAIAKDKAAAVAAGAGATATKVGGAQVISPEGGSPKLGDPNKRDPQAAAGVRRISEGGALLAEGQEERKKDTSPSVPLSERVKEWLLGLMAPTDPMDEDYDACSLEVRRRAPAPKTVAAEAAPSPGPGNKAQLTSGMECLDAFGVTDDVLVKADKVAQGVDSDVDSESVNDSEWLYCLEELQKEFEEREAGVGGAASPGPGKEQEVLS